MERLLGEVVGGVLQSGDDLGAVEPDGAVDAAVADEDDVVAVGDPARLAEVHVADPGAAFEAEDRYARTGRAGFDPRDG